MRPVPVVSEPFKKIAIDIIGELPRSKSGCKYILTIVDYATRYPEAIPLKNISSKTVADALIQCFTRLGIPEELVSDQGSNFVGKLMTQLYEHLGITKIQTSVYHPEANGLVERFNGTLKTMLRKFVKDSVQDWDRYLPYLLFAYREVPCESTGYSPFELLYGRTPRGPMAIIKESWLEEKPSEQNVVSHVLEIRKRMMKMQKSVAENLRTSQTKQKRLYDRKSSTRRFEEGDKVLVLLPTPGSKLETKWHGPYEITKVKDDGRSYEVDTRNKKKRHRTYYINLLKKWQDRDDVAALVIPEPVADVLPHEGSLLRLNDDETWKDVKISADLSTKQRKDVEDILEAHSGVLSGIPSRTTAAVHNIDTGDAQPIRSRPYKIPQRLEEEHLECLQCVLQRLRRFNLRARPSKCKIAMSVTNFVGHKVGSQTIQPKEILVQAVDRFPAPETKKQVRSFLGLVGYYRKFIPNFSERALALTDLTKGNCSTKVKWSDQCEVSFQDLKEALKGRPLLVPPNWEKEFVLQVDASQRGLGAILSQKDDDDEEHPIAFASRKLQPREEKLSTTEKECLAIVWAVEHFRYYLLRRTFTLQTDHNPLVWLNQVKDKNQKLLRWSVTLQEYSMNIEHKKGMENTNVDALSRV